MSDGIIGLGAPYAAATPFPYFESDIIGSLVCVCVCVCVCVFGGLVSGRVSEWVGEKARG